MTAVLAKLLRPFRTRRAGEPGRVPAPPTRGKPRRSARRAFAWFALAAVVFHLAVLTATDVLWPRLRDPEYGRRAHRLGQRLAENPGRPLVLALGSSRVGAGVRPTEWEASRPGRPGDPLVFNMAEVGSGPLIQLLTLNRVYHDGFRPAAVLVEYWPPFLSYDDWPEWDRVDPDRLYRSDLAVVRERFPNADRVVRSVARGWANPVYTLRNRFMIQVFPMWFTWPKRFDVAWNGLDAWGWLPGIDLPVAPTAERAKRLTDCEGHYKKGLPNYKIHPDAERNLRAVVELAREHGAGVAFYYLPEAAEFRGWYGKRFDREAREKLDGLSRELGVPVIDARIWMDDYHLVDGFHLSRVGAAEFTRKLMPAVAEALPGLRGGAGGKP